MKFLGREYRVGILGEIKLVSQRPFCWKSRTGKVEERIQHIVGWRNGASPSRSSSPAFWEREQHALRLGFRCTHPPALPSPFLSCIEHTHAHTHTHTEKIGIESVICELGVEGVVRAGTVKSSEVELSKRRRRMDALAGCKMAIASPRFAFL